MGFRPFVYRLAAEGGLTGTVGNTSEGVRMAGRAARELGIAAVGLTGGVMQNATLARLLPLALAQQGLCALTHHELPPGDGGLSLGQAVWGGRMLAAARS